MTDEEIAAAKDYEKRCKIAEALRVKWQARANNLNEKANEAKTTADEYMQAAEQCVTVSNSLSSFSDALKNDVGDLNTASDTMSKYEIGDIISGIVDSLADYSDILSSHGATALQISNNYMALAKAYQLKEKEFIDKYNELYEEAAEAEYKADTVGPHNCYAPEYQI